MQGQVKRKASIKRRMSLRRGSSIIPTTEKPIKEVPWDLLDRLLVPIICCHAAAIVLSTLLNVLRISQITAFGLFVWFAVLTITAVLFYHHLKVSSSGKTILITGCESPLAWYLARKLDDIGFTVFASFKTLIDNDDASVLKDESSGRLKLIQLDVTSEIQMLEASLFVTENLPDGANGLWALVHCETWCALGELEWVPFPVLRKALDVNILGAARLTQIMLPLIRRCNGRIIFLSSAMAKISSPVRGIHCATQAAIEGLATCLRKELQPRGINVSVIAAGEYTAGTAWLSDNAMVDQAKQMWNQLTDEQKEAYGEDYFESAIRSLEKYTKITTDYGPAVRSLISAIISSFPLPRYTPVTSSEKIQTIIAEYFPAPIYDTIYRL